MNNENLENFGELERKKQAGRRCSEEYSCVEDMYYFINLKPIFVN